MPNKSSLTHLFPWARYSKKLAQKIERPRSCGSFKEEETKQRKLHLAVGKEGDLNLGNYVALFWLVDPEDGVIVDAKFQVFGQSALIGASEAACLLLIGKNYDQAQRLTGDLIDKSVRDHPDIPAFPRETHFHLNLVLGAIEDAALKCNGLPFASTHASPPVPEEKGGNLKGSGFPGWMDLPLKRKLSVIEDVLDQDVRPYIALDAGGIEVLNLLNDKEIIIAYQGACTSCYSSIGTTLSYIQQTLRNKVHPEIIVTPNIDF